MNTILKTQSVSQLTDPDMQAVPAALARAGTPLIVIREGRLVEAMVTTDSLKPLQQAMAK
ncbi:MAG: hypothetical protein V4632_11115 [Pseudomonadota bacterium]